MLRILSTHSARQTLRPFFQKLLQELLAREGEDYRGNPARSLLLVQHILGRRQARTVLERFYRETTQCRFMTHSFLYRTCVHRFQHEGESGRIPRYVRRELAVPEDLRELHVAKRLPPPQPPPETQPARAPQEEPEKPAPPAGELSLSEADFRVLVRGVADALGRQSRLDTLRRGGI